MLDLNLNQLARLEYEERVREADLYRRMKAIQGDQPSVVENVLLAVSQFLINSGTQLKQRVEMRPSLS